MARQARQDKTRQWKTTTRQDKATTRQDKTTTKQDTDRHTRQTRHAKRGVKIEVSAPRDTRHMGKTKVRQDQNLDKRQR